MLQHPDSAGTLPHDLGDLLGTEPRQHAQRHHLRLIGRQPRDAPERGIQGQPRLELVRPIGRRTIELLRRHRIRSPPLHLSPGIDHASPGDREHPGPERRLIPVKAPQPPRHLQPHIRGHILRIGVANGHP